MRQQEVKQRTISSYVNDAVPFCSPIFSWNDEEKKNRKIFSSSYSSSLVVFINDRYGDVLAFPL